MRKLLVSVRALFFATCFVWFWGWAALAVEQFDTDAPRLPAWTAVPGLAAIVAGAALVGLCIALFVGVGRGTPAPFDPPRRFVAVGPYRVVRNPMYVGGFALLAGLALARQSASMLVFAAGWLLLVHLFVVGYEEPALRRRFGAEYARYVEDVPRWLPRP
jgi:protein-S-isoprenylcysteine O-methyltransferase Ste14